MQLCGEGTAGMSMSVQQTMLVQQVLHIGMQMWCEWSELWREYGEEYHSTHLCDTLKMACAALPECVLLSFALADSLHAAKKPIEAVAVYEVRYYGSVR